MVQQLGGPTAAIEAVKPPLNAALEAVGLQGYPAVGLVDANKVLGKRKRARKTPPPVSKAPPAMPKALPAAPPPKPAKPAKQPAKPAPPTAMALTTVKVSRRGGMALHRKVGGFAKEVLTNLKNKVVKRKADE